MKKNKNLFRSIIVTLIVMLSLTPFSTVGANSGSTQQTNDINLAEVFGSYDYSSNRLKTVIVELQEPSLIEAKHQGKKQSKQNLKLVRDKVKANMQSKVSNAVVNREYDYIFSGFSVQLKESEIPNLLSIKGIKAVYPNVEYTVDTLGMDFSIDASEIHPTMAESAPFIGSNQAWDLGYTGKGVKVAIIDTGVDYTHPDLVHAFGDYKGWDFVDNDNDPQETPLGDPRGDSTNHGTHVAGTVAANGNIKGIAPDATLFAYRVLGPGGSGSTENVIAGIERAVENGANVLNLSLGNTLNSPDWATSISLDWAMAEGVVAVTSNGNSGPNNWTVGSPGTSREAISVGATQLPYNVYRASVNTSEEVNYPSSDVMGFNSEEEFLELNGNTYEYVYVGLGDTSDFEEENVEGKIALISRGAIPFVTKAENAKAFGAVGAIIFNHLEGALPFYIPGMAVPTIKLDNVDGQKMLSELQAGNNEVTFDFHFEYEVDETIADFSSRGPVASSLMIKPDVSAPGVNITSTVPTHNNENPYGYASMQGTSMAAPHVAGAVAVLLEKYPNWNVYDVKGALMNTAEKVLMPNGELYPHNTQGAGSIRIAKALELETIVSPGSYSFGVFSKDKGRQIERQHFTVKNISNERKSYTFDFSLKENHKEIKVTTSNNVFVQPGQSQIINMNVDVDASKLNPGYYEGVITVFDGKQSVEVPTILFVQEPDYLRVTHASFEKDENNQFIISFFLPGGAEAVDVVIYKDEPWEYVGIGVTEYQFDAGYHDLTWDGKINGDHLEQGVYHMFVFAENVGVTDYIYAGQFEVN